MTKRYIYLMGAALLMYCSAISQNVVLNAVADNTIHSELINNSNGAGENFTAGVTCQSGIRRGLIKFDFSSIPAGATITGVSLQMTVNKAVSGASDFSIHRLVDTWGEGTTNAGNVGDGQGVTASLGDATWVCRFANGVGGCNSNWSISGGNFVSTASAVASVNGIGNYNWSGATLVTDAQNMFSNTASNHGWIITAVEEIATCSAKRFSSRTSSVIANRPTLTVSYTTVTPVNLSRFEAKAQQYGSLLVWETQQEINASFFEIQHSTDGFSFNKIGKVTAAGNASTLKKYSFVHQNASTGKNFYRLVQQDLDGQRYNSEVERVDIGTKLGTLLIAPNPVSNKLILPGLDVSGGIRYYIISIDGKQVAAGSTSSQSILLPTSIQSGVYKLQLKSADGTIRSASFMKQ
ncbi:MAG: DNRLRE domain-containing protein [Ferruginibacter sp.]